MNKKKYFSSLTSKMSIKAQEAIAEKTELFEKEMLLRELRQHLSISQEMLAEFLVTKQANISRMERRKDMYISTLKEYIEAMGGKLEIIAKFPEGDIKISQFAMQTA